LETGCPCCDGHKIVKSNCLRTTHPDLCNEWNYEKNTISPDNVSYASNKKAWWKCELGHEWYCKIYTRTRGDQCPICASSKGEKVVKEWLDDNCIKYEREYILRDCRDKRPLSFDFAIFKNDKLFGLIEYQGIHHYEPRAYFGGIKYLQDVKYKDKIKLDYCVNKNIPLLAIPYWELKNVKTLVADFVLAVQ